MGIASFLVWREGLHVPVVRWALSAYLLQLALNVAWPFAFFGARSPGAGLLVLLLLAPAVLATLLLFWHVSDAAGWLLLPYALWTAFALALNASIWVRN
jgi:tryptophan-rich sensory protein